MYVSGGSERERGKREEGEDGEEEEERKEVLRWKTSCTESADATKSCHLRLEKTTKKITGSLLLIRLCRHTTAHFVLACPWMCDLNINDVIIHSFILNNYSVMR